MILLGMGQFSQAQTEVVLRFAHYLDGKTFALSQEAKSPMGTKYKVTRLQFYISGLKITHDGGKELSLNTLYLLVDPSKKTNKEFSLGALSDITNIEKIDFAIGVDAASNHLDPASFPPDHPLAPKNPEMNWGWTSGYRFISLSANAARSNGSFIDAVSIEGLGDVNYKINSYPITGKLENGKIYIDMNAEYNKLLENIAIEGGASNHGETGSAADLVSNATLKVFSPASPTSTKDAYNNTQSEVIYISGSVSVKYLLPSISNLQFQLYDINGNTIKNERIESKEGFISIDNQIIPGNYFYAFTQGNQTLSTGKIVKR